MNKFVFTLAATILGSGYALTSGAAQENAGSSNRQVFSIPPSGLDFLTGDTWIQNNQKLRLYGVQSCLRGTTYTDGAGQRQDCGAVSLAMLAALVRDTRPECSPVAQITASPNDSHPTVLVVCSAHIGNETVDLGTALITQGFAFAALSNDGAPVYFPYAAAEAIAKQARAGLWAYADIPHPNAVLSNVMRLK
uniref:Succinoglycan biosynthesis protein n=1 Tax=Ochrobactrum sp. LM19 TaxID=1449781 RepID=A0A0D5A0P1_9HYPH|nr:thermonuclease family protein [Ochrobactrum sp. LM19]AJW29979.1 hypothetical protein pLM19O2_p34 [Ochrobactrum sp. LM19]